MSRLSYKTLFIIVLFLLIPIVFLLRINQKATKASAAWWNDSWMYRQRIDITGIGSTALSDFQISFDIGTSALIAAGKMKSDCSDIRITDQFGDVMPYWIEENNPGCNQTTATKVWTKLSSLPTSGGVAYAYYGNPSATATQNGSTVFDFFEDFNSASLDTTRWTATGAYTLSGGTLTITTGAVYSNSPILTTAQNYVYEYRNTWTSTTGGYSGLQICNDNHISSGNGGSNQLATFMTDSGANLNVRAFAANGTVASYNLTSNSAQYTATQGTPVVDSIAVGTSAIIYSNNRTQTNAYSGTFTGAPYLWLGFFTGNLASTTDIKDMTTDWVIVHKYSSAIPTATPAAEEVGGGPIAYWKFDEGVGTSAYDSTSNHENGSLSVGVSAPIWAPEDQCVSGKCLLFDKGNQYVKVSNLPSPMQTNESVSFSISAWIKPSQVATTLFQPIVAQLRNSYMYFGLNGDKLQLSLDDGIMAFTKSIIPNQWTHVAVSYNGVTKQATFIVNGQIDNTANNGDLSSLINYLYIGYESRFGNSFVGYIDDVKFFPFARTPSLFINDYATGLAGQSAIKSSSINIGSNSLKSLSDGLIAYYKFDEGVGSTSADSSGNSNLATFTGSNNFASGKFGNGFRPGVGSTNLTINPSLETNTTGWSCWHNSGTGACVSSTDTAVFGSNSWKSTMTADGSQGNQIGAATVSGSTTYTVSAWVKISTWGGSNFTFYMREYYPTGNGQCGATMYTATGITNGWIRISGTCTTRADTTTLYVSYYLGSTLQTVYTDGIQVEPSSTLSSYFDGSQGIGSTWTGTAHASTSIRTASMGVVSNSTSIDITSNQISSSAWVYLLTYPDTNGVVFQKNGYSAGYRLMIDSTGHAKIGIGESNGGTLTSTGTILLNSWTHLSMTYDGQTIKAFINGQSSGSTSYTNNLRTSTSNITFGATEYPPISGYIDEVRIYNRALSPSEIKQIYEYDPTATATSRKPIAYYKFDENAGTVVNNSGSIGSTINGDFAVGSSAPSWAIGKIGKALNFNGTTSYIDITNNSNFAVGTGDYSFSAWFNTTNPATGQMIINHRGGDEWLLGISGAKLNFYIYDSATAHTTTINGTTTLQANTWYHALVTLNRTGSATIYLNGIINGSGSITGVPDSIIPTGVLRIGYNATGNSGGWATAFFNGLIDEVKIYNYALTSDEVKSDYNQSSSFVFGISNQTIGGTTTSLNYCLPGDTSYCANPIAEWKMDEGTGTTAYDTSSNGNFATFAAGSASPSWTTGKIGKALSFNGSDYANVSSSTSLNVGNSLTISAWIKPTSLASRMTIYAASNNNTAGAFQLEVGPATGGTNTVAVIINGTWIAQGTNNVITPGIWQHVTYTRNGTGANNALYVNGIGISLVTNSSTTFADNAVAKVIGERTSSSQLFNGQIDQLRLYNYARTPAQIAWDYNQGAPIGWWKFDECQGSIAHDSSGIGNTGSINIGISGTQNTLGTCSLGTSAAWTAGATGKFGGSLNFDGNDDYVNILSSGLNTIFNGSEGSMSLWIKSDSSFWSDGILRRQIYFTVNDNNRIFLTKTAANQLAWTYCSGGTCKGITIPTTTTSWFHTIITWSKTNDQVKVYFNGSQSGSTQTGLGTFVASPLVSASIAAEGSSRIHAGQIDDVRIYNYPLTSTQIQTLYNGGAINFN